MSMMNQGTTLNIVVVGVGRVGRAVATQLMAGAETMRNRCGAMMRIIGVVDRSAMMFDTAGLPAAVIERALHAKQRGDSLASLPSHVARLEPDTVRELALATPGIVFVDTTADPDTGRMWRLALDAGASVVLANKLPLCRSWAEAGSLFAHSRLRYEATVGAGLPVISTLRRLLDSGDRIERIQASMSGTLAYLMHRVSTRVPLSAAVAEAIDSGYAEPDPREDLRGADVARKALILARTLGWAVEPPDVVAESLYPDRLDACDLPSFLHALPALDAEFAARVSAAAAEGRVLRYVASIVPADESIGVGIGSFSASRPFAFSAGADNRIEFRTERYGTDSLAVCGPGAGPQVTAMGVLSDLVDLAFAAHREGP
ncbi:homoserine dehydrogenase [Candidatus Bipolaricaulota bacterium]|nr:homoserine dehydrogenase [Candidatus Bipolaricaulota bacterium]